MSEFFNDKDYGDYFAAIESRLEPKAPKIQPVQKAAPAKRVSRRHRAILRRRAFIAGMLAIVISIYCI